MNYASNQAAAGVMPLDVALYRACKASHGNIAAIAANNGFNLSTFTKQVDINFANAQVSPEGVEAILRHTKAACILDSIAAAHGGVAWFEIPDVTHTASADFLLNIAKIANEFSDLCNTVSNAMQDNHIDELERLKIKKDGYRLISAVLAVMALADAKAVQDE